MVNRAPVLTLWAAVVADVLGCEHDEALTLGRAAAGLNVYSKGIPWTVQAFFNGDWGLNILSFVTFFQRQLGGGNHWIRREIWLKRSNWRSGPIIVDPMSMRQQFGCNR